MPSNEEIKRILSELEKEPFPVHPFWEKWQHLLFPPLLEMVPVPSGSFQMGSEGGEGNEKPVHRVSLDAFKMARYPVTFKQWQEVKEWAEKNGYTFLNQGQQGAGSKTDENHPVTTVSWFDAALWCNAMSEKEGSIPCYYTDSSKTDVYRSGRVNMENGMVKWEAEGYRLSTEAEWEYACRAGTKTEYSFGDRINHSRANYDRNINGTTPAGKYGANDWGLCDMHGNVWEWCWDRYDSEYYEKSPDKNPRGSSEGSARVLRGGGWYNAAASLRSARRIIGRPDDVDVNYGFRPVCKSE